MKEESKSVPIPHRRQLPHPPAPDFDFHTHNLQARAGQALVCLPPEVLIHPEEFKPREGVFYSAGLHPWVTNDEHTVQRLLSLLPQWLEHPQVAAVGECGLDALRGAELEQQTAILTAQLKMADEARLPVVLHVVRAFDRLLHLHKVLHPRVRWTVHGFRGKPALAQQLLDAGFDLSFGLKRNEAAYALTPPERRWNETDDSTEITVNR